MHPYFGMKKGYNYTVSTNYVRRIYRCEYAAKLRIYIRHIYRLRNQYVGKAFLKIKTITTTIANGYVKRDIKRKDTFFF